MQKLIWSIKRYNKYDTLDILCIFAYHVRSIFNLRFIYAILNYKCINIRNLITRFSVAIPWER